MGAGLFIGRERGTGVIIYCVLLHHAVAAAAIGTVRYRTSKPHQIHFTCNSDLWYVVILGSPAGVSYWLLVVTRNV